MADAAVQMGCELGKSLVTQWLWPPIKCRLDYWRCYHDNVQGLRDEIGLLEREKCNMNQKIEEARLRAESHTTDVQGWLKVGDQKLEEAERILQGCDGLKAWNIISRYSWGKRAKKTAERIARLRNEANAVRISDPPPPPAMAPIPHKPTMEFESRKRVEEDIMEFLRDDRTCMIAICGAGGVGKTTMVSRIKDRVHKVLFDEVVLVVVSQPVVMLKIQMEIAELLGLKFSEDTLAARAHKLCIRLQDSKRKLIIFDDVWKSFDLKDIGVPFENGFTKCKIILTSRITDACNEMGAKIIRMELLKEEEAWDLFKDTAGSSVEGPDLRPIAENVVAECKRLPVALVTVGVALKCQSIYVWKDSLSKLRRSIPTDFPEVLDKVYKPLKLSYDFLENSVKNLFLLCCLFPEDHNIPIEHLTLYSFGLRMFEGIRDIEEGRNRTCSVVEKLKSRFLLLDGDWRGHRVKMHDVVRDVAIFIGSNVKDGFLMNSLEAFSMDSSSKDSSRNCNWMSLDISSENAKLPVGSDFPNLRFMMIQDSTFNYFKILRSGVPNKEVDVNNVICFEGMQGLKVLSISRVYFRSLPSTMELLKELRTLHLESCFVEDISVLGELACLEILCIGGCPNIEELPTDIGRLNFLRLLELNDCISLRRIVTGVISSLDRLEELKIIGCFDKWEAKGNQSQERNAGLSELESLPNLTSLEIQISDWNLLAEEICLSQKLVRYRICTVAPRGFSSRDESERGISRFPNLYRTEENERVISLYLPGDITVGNWISQLARSTRSLVLSGDGQKFLDQFHVKPIKLAGLEEIIYGSISEGSNFIQKLESIRIKNLPKLAHLWKSQNQNVSLGNLKSISIYRCPNLCYLFSVATARSLVQLQSLAILYCDKIEQVLWNGMESNTDASIIEFPNLQQLTLSNLPNLAAFSQGVEIIESLHQLTIINCPKLRTKIGKCPNLIWVNFGGSQHLPCSYHTIQELVISDCESIEEILWDEIKDEGERHIIFPELKRLTLSNLPCLTTFCRGVESIEFPKLERMKIGNLPRMNSLLPLDLVEATHGDHHSLHFFCNPKVEFLRLEELSLFELPDTISKIWCRHVPITFFHNLETLKIFHVNDIGNLISSSIAENLMNLKVLSIKRCKDMVDVIEDETESFATTLFRNLEILSIETLHKLRRFCQWKHAFVLPSLKKVEIVDCPRMETFTLGSLSTPYLSRFFIDNEVKTKDLNGAIRDQFRIKIEDEDKNKDEDDEHENSSENKKEAKDEEKMESSKSKFL